MADEVTETPEVHSTDLLASTRLTVPPMSISGRNDAGLALVDAGATRTIERDRKVAVLERWKY